MTEDMLKNYKHIAREIKHIEEEIETLRWRAQSPRVSIISDMPKGSISENDKMAELVVKFEELETRYKILLEYWLDKRHEIETAVETLNSLERDVIRYFYIDGLSVEKCLFKLHVSRRTFFRIRKRAVNKICKSIN